MAIDNPSPPTGKIPQVHLPKVLGNVLFLAIFPLVALCLFETFARGSAIAMMDWGIRRPLFFLQNLGLLAGLFWLLALVRSDRARLMASIGMVTLCCLLGIVSFYKIRYRFEPILLTDVALFADARNVVEQIDLKINWWQLAQVLGFSLLGTGMALVFVRGVRPRRSVVWPLAGVALCCAMIPLCSFDSLIQGKNVDLAECANQGGTLYTVVASERQRQSLLRVRYEEGDIQEAWQRIQREPQADGPQTSNIILILSESFTDAGHLGQYLDLQGPLMPFYEALVQTCASGDIYVPKQGGGTSETEFEVLTGLQSAYSVNPYSMGIPPLHSLAATLRERGYHTSAIHWFNGIFYNRYKNLRLLGFDEFHTTDTDARPLEKVGMFISDREHYRSVLGQMKETPGKDFVFCITMQNHGTYGYDDFAARYGAKKPFNEALSPFSEKILNNYSYLLQQSDEALEELIGTLEAFPEPTLVVLFGDHTPPFEREVYQEIGMPVEGEEAHLCPYLIWSNQGNTLRQADMKAWQLGAYALAQAGIHSDPFFAHIEALREQGQQTDGDYEALSYDALFGKQRAYAWAGYQMDNKAWQIGGKMELLAWETLPMDGAVFVRPHLANPWQRFKLAVNGAPLDDWMVLDTKDPFTLQCVMLSPNGKQLNQTGIFTFASTKDLLARSFRSRAKPLALSQVPLHMEQETSAYYLLASSQDFAAPVSCLTLQGERQEWQPSYGIRKPGQYSLAREYAPLVLAVDKKLFPAGPPSPAQIAQEMAAQEAKLWLMNTEP